MSVTKLAKLEAQLRRSEILNEILSDQLNDMKEENNNSHCKYSILLNEYEKTIRKYRVYVYALQHKVDDAYRISDRIIDDIEQEANDEIDALMKG